MGRAWSCAAAIARSWPARPRQAPPHGAAARPALARRSTSSRSALLARPQGSQLMIIDIFTHVLPRDFTAALERSGSRFGLLKRLMEVRELHDLDRRFRTMDALGDYRQVVALPHPPIEDFAEPRHGAELARIGNDGMAELVGRHPDRFAGFIAALSMTDMDACLQEIDRAITVLGAGRVHAALRRRHLDYSRMFHADTALCGASRGLDCGIGFFGAGNVVFASDAPFGPIPETREAIAAGDLDAASRAAILHGNAERLLRRKVA